jgi:hypothetical protein
MRFWVWDKVSKELVLTMHFKNDANILPQMIFFAKA